MSRNARGRRAEDMAYEIYITDTSNERGRCVCACVCVRERERENECKSGGGILEQSTSVREEGGGERGGRGGGGGREKRREGRREGHEQPKQPRTVRRRTAPAARNGLCPTPLSGRNATPGDCPSPVLHAKGTLTAQRFLTRCRPPLGRRTDRGHPPPPPSCVALPSTGPAVCVCCS